MLKSKLFVFDIDGTILNTEYQILSSTKRAMSLVRENGGKIMLASARTPRAIDPIAEELGLEPLYVSLNGALLVRNEHILYEKSMKTEVSQRVIEIALAGGLSVNVYSQWDWFIGNIDDWTTHEGNMVGYHGEVRDLKTVREIHKILLLGEQEKIMQIQAQLAQHVPEVLASLSIPHYMEVVDASCNKGKGLEIMSELLDVDHKDIVAFGDGENDLAMLKLAGFSVAMGNAHPSLKAEADLVTDSNNEDGVLQAVLKILDFGGERQ